MKKLPHNDEAERGVLSCCLQDPKCIGEAVERIGDEVYFYDLRRERLFRVLVEQYQSGKADFLTIQSKLKEQGILDSIGGIQGLLGLQDYAPSTANLPTYLDELEGKATHRKLIRVSGEILDKAYKAESGDEVIDQAEKEILSVRAKQKKSKTTMELVDDALVEMERLYSLEGQIGGFTTGLSDLDYKTDGVHKGEMIVLAGFPSTGKTTLAMNIAETNALAGVPVGVMSAEMAPYKLTLRSMCSVSGINSADIRRKNLSPEDFAKVNAAAVMLRKSPLYIENASGMTVQQVHAVARRLKQRHDIQLLVVDYLQLLSCKADSREQEVSGISKGLKAIAMELNIPVLALSQLNDDGKLRESRAIGQDADSVWKLENNGEWVADNQPIKLIVEKNRDGETGIVELLFKKSITKFVNAAKIPAELA